MEYSLCLSLSRFQDPPVTTVSITAFLCFVLYPLEGIIILPYCDAHTDVVGTHLRVDPNVATAPQRGCECAPAHPLALISTVYLARCRYFVRPNEWSYRQWSAGWRSYLPISVAIKAILCRQHCGWLDTLVRHVGIVIADVEAAAANADSIPLVTARADTRRCLGCWVLFR